MQFKIGVIEHLGKSYRTDSLLQVPVPSHIREHCYERDHTLNPEKFAIINRLRLKNDLLILESLHQITKKPTIGMLS